MNVALRHKPSAFLILLLCSLALALQSPTAPAEEIVMAPITVDCAKAENFSRAVLGLTPHRGDTTRADALKLLNTAGIHGPTGGIDADTYNWKDPASGRETADPKITTLQLLREAKERTSEVVITVNARGFGKMEGDTWTCADTPVAELAKLAADWVTYCNVLIPKYNNRSRIPKGPDKDLIDSIKWGTAPVLPDNKEVLRRVMYWQIGCTPEIDTVTGYISGHSMTVEKYVAAYKEIALAMKAADPTIRIGPYLSVPGTEQTDAYIKALLTDGSIPVDYIGYRPESTGLALASVGGDVAAISEALHKINDRELACQTAVGKIASACGRNVPRMPVMVCEWSLDGSKTETEVLGKSMAMTLGITETVLTYASMTRFFAAAYANSPSTTPMANLAFSALYETIGDGMAYSAKSPNEPFRLYVTLDRKENDVAVWGLNFTETQIIKFNLSIINPPIKPKKVLLKRLAPRTGASSLKSGPDVITGWVTTDVTSKFLSKLGGFEFAIDPATISILLIQ